MVYDIWDLVGKVSGDALGEMYYAYRTFLKTIAESEPRLLMALGLGICWAFLCGKKIKYTPSQKLHGII